MAGIAQVPGEGIQSFSKGVNRDAPRTMLPDGYYEDADNMVLYSKKHGGQHLATMLGQSVFDAAVVWPGSTAHAWLSPYTLSTISGGVLTFTSHLLYVTKGTAGSANSAFYRFDPGSPGTNTLVRRGFQGGQNWTHTLYDELLIVMNGRDAVMKYGQPFLPFTNNPEARPFLFPLGSKPISPMGAALDQEVWTHGAGGSFVADASVPDGGSRVHTHSLFVAANTTTTLTWTGGSTRDFNAGPVPYGGTNFATTDEFHFSYYKAATAGSIRWRFETTAGVNYFEYTQVVLSTGTWVEQTVLRNTFTTVGAPNWNSIARISFTNLDAANNVYLDDHFMMYADNPPDFQVATTHKGRVVGGGAATEQGVNVSALSSLYWSRANFPDEFPAANTQVIAGGLRTLARASQITACREYQDSVLVGTPCSIFSWTIGTDGLPSRTNITTEIGIDSQRGLVEIPSGSLMFPWQRGIYLLRSTARTFASAKLGSDLEPDLLEPWWTHAAVDERTKTVRFWWRETGDTACTAGVIFDYNRSALEGEPVWTGAIEGTSEMADYTSPAFVEGESVVLVTALTATNIYVMSDVGATSGHTSEVVLPWMAREGKDKVTKWLGCVIPYAATSPVLVDIRYASHPQDFTDAKFTNLLTLNASPTIGQQARVLFGQSSRWAQVRLRATAYGFEVFPPIEMIAMPTYKQP